jgi:hypothetical protein
MGAGEDIVAQQKTDQLTASAERQRGEQSGVRQALARCTKCRERGHNPRSCKKDSLATA